MVVHYTLQLFLLAALYIDFGVFWVFFHLSFHLPTIALLNIASLYNGRRASSMQRGAFIVLHPRCHVIRSRASLMIFCHFRGYRRLSGNFCCCRFIIEPACLLHKEEEGIERLKSSASNKLPGRWLQGPRERGGINAFSSDGCWILVNGLRLFKNERLYFRTAAPGNWFIFSPMCLGARAVL